MNEPFLAESAVEEVNLWRAIQKHWIAVLFVTLGVFAVALYQAIKQTPFYQSQALILMANQVSVPVIKTEDNGSSPANEVDATYLEILKSPTLLSRTVKKLSSSYPEMTIYQILSSLSLTQPNQTNILSITYRDTNPQRAKAVVEALILTYLNYAEESRRSPVTNAIRFIEQQLPAAEAALNQSSSALTAFRKEHDLDNPDNKADLAFQTQEQIEEQIREAEMALNVTEQKYQQLQQQIKAVGQDPSIVLVDSVLSQDNTYQNLLSQLKELETQYALEGTRYSDRHPLMKDLKARRDKMKQLLENHIYNLIGSRPSQVANKSVVSGPIQQELANQLRQTQIDLKLQTQQLNDLRKFEDQANVNFQKIVQIQQEYKELERQYQFHSQAVDDFLKKLQELQVREAQEISTWKVLEAPEIPSESLSSNLKRQLLLGLIAGGILGVGTAFMLEKLDKRLNEVDSVKKIMGLPILGLIPNINFNTFARKNSDEQLSKRIDPFTEAVRSIALTLLFKKAQSTHRIILITSSVEGEGKTTLTYNLGLALAELGQKVLIVDADFNQPRIHQVFQLPNTSGLSTAIATGRPWQELVQSSHPKNWENCSEFQENNNLPSTPFSQKQSDETPLIFAQVLTNPNTSLNHLDNQSLQTEGNALIVNHPDILTSGPVPTTSIAWLTSDKMGQLLEQWREVYHFVLIDTPSLTELADTQSLTPQVDQVILTVNMKSITHSILSETLEILQRNQSDKVELVINKINLPAKNKVRSRS